MDTIYKVTTEGDVEGRSVATLGYATGDQNDIRNYFNDRKYYSLSLQAITVINVTPQSAKERLALINEKAELETKLKGLSERISKT